MASPKHQQGQEQQFSRVQLSSTMSHLRPQVARLVYYVDHTPTPPSLPYVDSKGRRQDKTQHEISEAPSEYLLHAVHKQTLTRWCQPSRGVLSSLRFLPRTTVARPESLPLLSAIGHVPSMCLHTAHDEPVRFLTSRVCHGCFSLLRGLTGFAVLAFGRWRIGHGY